MRDREPAVNWKLLTAVVTIFVAGLATIAWADARYARADQVAVDRDSVQQDLREIKQDIKTLLGRTK